MPRFVEPFERLGIGEPGEDQRVKQQLVLHRQAAVEYERIIRADGDERDHSLSERKVFAQHVGGQVLGASPRAGSQVIAWLMALQLEGSGVLGELAPGLQAQDGGQQLVVGGDDHHEVRRMDRAQQFHQAQRCFGVEVEVVDPEDDQRCPELAGTVKVCTHGGQHPGNRRLSPNRSRSARSD